MNKTKLINYWKEEEKKANIHGWDFSYLNNRMEEDCRYPWDYKELIMSYIKDEDKILDIDTGGGEFLLSLNHKADLVSATEGYPPNVELCKKSYYL